FQSKKIEDFLSSKVDTRLWRPGFFQFLIKKCVKVYGKISIYNFSPNMLFSAFQSKKIEDFLSSKVDTRLWRPGFFQFLIKKCVKVYGKISIYNFSPNMLFSAFQSKKIEDFLSSKVDTRLWRPGFFQFLIKKCVKVYGKISIYNFSPNMLFSAFQSKKIEDFLSSK